MTDKPHSYECFNLAKTFLFDVPHLDTYARAQEGGDLIQKTIQDWVMRKEREHRAKQFEVLG